MLTSGRLLALLTALALAAFVAACQPDEPEVAAPDPAEPEPAEPDEPDTPEPTPDEAEPPVAYSEAPELAELVDAGELPPVEERLPAEPVVVEPWDEIGTYGGTWRSAVTGPGDTTWWYRTVGYEQLMRLEPYELELFPNVARDYEVNDDATEYTFYLREGMRWSDGEPFTAHDIVFWYEDVVSMAELGGMPSWMITGDEPGVVEAIDDHTVRFSFPGGGHGMLAERMAMSSGDTVATYPRHYLEQFHINYAEDIDAVVAEHGAADWVDLFDTMTGVGANFDPDLPTLYPWRMVNRLGDEAQVVFERNPYYWKVDPEGNQLPYLDRVIFDVAEDAEVVLFKAINGELDMHERHFTGMVNKPLLAEHREAGDYDFFDTTPSTMNVGVIALNHTHEDPGWREIFQNREFRIGLSHAINRQEIIDVVYQSQGEPWQGAPRPESRFYHEQLAKQYTEYDVDLANQYLDEAGFAERDADGVRLGPDGRRISFDYDVALGGGHLEGMLPDAMELIEGFWRDVGVEIRLNTMERSLFQVRSEDNAHDALTWTGFGGDDLTAVLDPRWYFPFTTGQSNWAGLWAHWFHGNPEGEEPPEPIRTQMELYGQMLSTPDRDEQDALFNEILDIAAEEFYVIGIALTPDGYGIVKNNFHNVPDRIPDFWPYPHPGYVNPEQFYTQD